MTGGVDGHRLFRSVAVSTAQIEDNAGANQDGADADPKFDAFVIKHIADGGDHRQA